MIHNKTDNVKSGWLKRLNVGLKRSSDYLTDSLRKLTFSHKLDEETLSELEDILISADLGVPMAAKVIKNLSLKNITPENYDHEIKKTLAAEISSVLDKVSKPIPRIFEKTPYVMLVCGVNGSGKTTTIGKIAHQLVGQGNSVLLAAADTFRAGATEQLKIWGDRTNCEVFSKDPGSDPASLVYDALEKAINDRTDVLIIDTAGRLQNKSELMEELNKIVRVIKKLDPDAPHARLLLLDATVGQNAHSQVKLFSEAIDISGIIMTKLDGTAKGGVLVSIASQYDITIHAIGVGEALEDLNKFDPNDFALSLVGDN
mgnify:FL=1